MFFILSLFCLIQGSDCFLVYGIRCYLVAVMYYFTQICLSECMRIIEIKGFSNKYNLFLNYE